MKDVEDKKVYFSNNSLGTFENNIGRYNNLAMYNVVE